MGPVKESTRETAANALDLENSGGIASILGALDPRQEPDELMRIYAAGALGSTGRKDGFIVEALTKALDPVNEESSEVRSQAARSLSQIRCADHRVLESLAKATDPDHEPNWYVRFVAAGSFARLGDARGLAILKRALELEEQGSVRAEIERALKDLEGTVGG